MYHHKYENYIQSEVDRGSERKWIDEAEHFNDNSAEVG